MFDGIQQYRKFRLEVAKQVKVCFLVIGLVNESSTTLRNKQRY